MLKNRLFEIFNSGRPANVVSRFITDEIKTEIEECIKIFPLKTDIITEKVYWILNDLKEYPKECKCVICSKLIEKGKFKSVAEGYSKSKKYCSRKCSVSAEEVRHKREQTNLINCGHISNMWGKEVREKTIEKWIEKFGVDHPMKNDNVMNSVYETNLRVRGVKMPAQDKAVLEVYKQTCMRLYGVDNVFKTDKSKNACMEKYGVPNPMQHPSVFNKRNTYKRKEDFFLSGKIFHYQGYENVAIHKLENLGIDENEISIGDANLIPTIKYHNPIKNKMCNYFPDVYIESLNLIVEVKSEYTITRDLDITKAKHLATEKENFIHEIWVCSKKEFLYKFIF